MPITDPEAPAAAPTPVTANTTPNATVSLEQVEEAIDANEWTHDVAGTALWLNTSFRPHGRSFDALAADLALHGIAIS